MKSAERKKPRTIATKRHFEYLPPTTRSISSLQQSKPKNTACGVKQFQYITKPKRTDKTRSTKQPVKVIGFTRLFLSSEKYCLIVFGNVRMRVVPYSQVRAKWPQQLIDFFESKRVWKTEESQDAAATV